jgi:hypothetical protein
MRSKDSRGLLATFSPSKLTPFLRQGLDILFVGLNPAKGSSDKGRYFSVNQAFWDQLLAAGLITLRVDKSSADVIVFGSTSVNVHNWQFGMTDLVSDIACSNSRLIRPTRGHTEKLIHQVDVMKPRATILMHSKVTKAVCEYLGIPYSGANPGRIGVSEERVGTALFGVAFPHGNWVANSDKVIRYIQVREFLEHIR